MPHFLHSGKFIDLLASIRKQKKLREYEDESIVYEKSKRDENFWF